jgi:EmrB/QacA subfamily drug resistance transporter
MTQASKTWVLALVSAASLMAALDAMVVATSLSTIRVQLDVSIETLQWTLNAYNLTFAVLLLAGASLGDRFGRRRMFNAGVAIFVAASAACALAPNAVVLIAARAVQGMGAALVLPLAMALLSATFPPNERGRALGIFSGVTGLGIILGPLLGGAIAQGVAWQWIFWINIPIGLALIPLAHRRIPESFGPDTTIDLPGAALVTLAALAVVLGLMRGNELGWASGSIVGLLAGGVVLAAAFVAWERRAEQPMIPLRLFRSRAFGMGVATTFLTNAGMYGVVFFLPQFFQSAQHHGPLGAGLRLLPWTATLFFVAPIAGRLINRLGERLLIVTGVVLQAIGFAWIGTIASSDVAFASLAFPLVIAGGGVSMAMPATQNIVLSAVDRADIGKAAGVFNMFRFLGGVSGIAGAVAIFTVVGGTGLVMTFSSGFSAAIHLSAVFSLAAAATAMALRSGKPSQSR